MEQSKDAFGTAGDNRESADGDSLEIAIVGMAGKFPAAPDIQAFWDNISSGVESVTRFTDAELRQRGVPDAVLADPSYVKAGVVLEGMDQFDAAFFGYAPREAEHLDPQQRLFLECAWQALEHAGYDPDSYGGSIGVFGGTGAGLYWIKHLLPFYSLENGGRIADLLGLLSGNSPDSLCTRVAYKLNLRGPAVTVQTACSTSLMAVHTACQALLGYECDMALAGGVSLNLLQNGGYFHQTGAIFSPDGHCRAFDANAGGTLLGSGAGTVVLKRLQDAQRDGDTIHAIIRGSAANNDGADKVGFTAPGVNGQASVIRAAQLAADVMPDTIGYIEAHGTGTPLGDPIEIAALTAAFRSQTQRRNFCAVGSVKTNIGHLDAAAGIAGLIKTVLALQHRTLPASLNFSRPNPAIDFSGSPFFVNTETRPWPAQRHPRRAGVSSFGIGGTNVHVILEEAPPIPAERAGENGASRLIVPLSARSEPALRQMCEQLADHLEKHSQQAPADIAYTLLNGRRRFSCRAVALGTTRGEIADALRASAGAGFFQGKILSAKPGVAFLFPGQGAQHPGMGWALYAQADVFRRTVQYCCERLRPHLDLGEYLYPADADNAGAAEQLQQTAVTQPALFVVEYALAQQWLAWGLRPDAMLGHSIGEYVAACLAGVFSLDDALDTVVERGRLIQATLPGAMLAVHAPSEAVSSELQRGCDLAAVNAENLCVLSGTAAVIADAENTLALRGVTTQRLHVSHAFHSALLDPVLPDFRKFLQKIPLNKPQIPFVSNVTGGWITAEQACSPEYWVQHLRQTVRFHDGVGALLEKPDRVLLEVGPGETLSTLSRRHPKAGVERPVLASQCHPKRREQNGDQPALCAAQLWVAGVDLDYGTIFRSADARFKSADARRIPLPTYPFERQSFWVQPAQLSSQAEQPRSANRNIADWLYRPVWKRDQPSIGTTRPAKQDSRRTSVLILGNRGRLVSGLLEHFHAVSRPAVWVETGPDFARLGERHYRVRVDDGKDMEQLLRRVEAELEPVADIFHLWSFGCELWNSELAQRASHALDCGFYSLLALAQALEATDPGGRKVAITVVTDGLEDIAGTESLCPEKAALYGPCLVIPQENPRVRCRLIDAIPAADEDSILRLVRQLAAEMEAADTQIVAYRGPHRWRRTFEAMPSGEPAVQRFRQKGVYLITGGLGGMGLALARHLAQTWQARLVLLGRSALPPREAWPSMIAAADPDSALALRLQAVLELEALGAEVLVLEADVADTARMRAVIAEIKRHFGALNGVVHAAGEAAGSDGIAHKTRAKVERIFAPKMLGTRALLAAIGEETGAGKAIVHGETIVQEPLDFVVFCSSLASVVGGLGKIDYAAANAYLDAVATVAARTADRMVASINWDGWREVGMAAGMKLPEHIGIKPQEGALLFERVINGPVQPQTLVSTTDPNRRFNLQDSDVLAAAALADNSSRRNRPRPALQGEYTAPQGAVQEALAILWSQALGIAPVGAQDNLFELGGDSLLAIQLLAKVRAAYGVDIHPGELFKTPTIATLAELIEIRLIEEIESADSEENPEFATA